jgi:dolichol-phosphate mannosyltransferase
MLLALNTATTNSNKLLHLTFNVGIFTSVLALMGIGYFVYQYFTRGSLQGWTSTMVVIMFFSGLILTAIGICSIYISNIFDQTKNRPRYLVSRTINCSE